MLIIKPYIFWIKIILAIFLADQQTRPDKTILSMSDMDLDFIDPEVEAQIDER